jgi:phosphoribosylformylglycinamidine synthase
LYNNFVPQLVSVLQDRMTECRYVKPLASFDLDVKPQPWFEVDVLGSGQKALAEVDKALGTYITDIHPK